MPPKRILLAETHPTFLGVVRLLLKDTMAAMFMVADEASLTEAIAGAQFDLVIADLSFPVSSGKNVIRLLQSLNPEIRAIILSVHDEQTVLDECLAAGAKGFVLKRTASTDLLAAVEAVSKGGTYISSSCCTQTEKPERNETQ